MSIKAVLKRLLWEDNFYEKETIRDEKSLSAVIEESTITLKPLCGEVHGTVSVSGGKILVTDPENEGSYATLIIPDNPMVQVIVNGEQVQGEVVLSKSHEVNIKFSSIEPSVSYDVIVSDDELSVSIKANVVTGAEFHLIDSIPRRHLRLEVGKSHSYPRPVSSQVILELLSKHGYNGAIDYIAVNRLCNAQGNQQEIVLRGTASQLGRPARLRLSTSVHADREPVFRTVRFSKVVIGNVCAVLEPEIEGKSGENVYGVPIPPPKSERKLPTFGDGVIDVNGNIVAARDGRLIYKKNLIDVVPEIVFETDVSAEDGEIQFHGNIVVHGSIRDGATVKTSGMITVYGDIESSSVFSGEGALVQGGIYGSTLVSGHKQFNYDELSRLLDRMIPELKRFEDEFLLMVAYAIKRSDAYSTIPRIPAILFAKRHENLAQMLRKFVNDYSDELCGSDAFYRELMELVGSTWSDDNRHKVSQRDSELLLEKLVSFSNRIKSIPMQRPFVKASDISTSTVRSVGNIIIKRNCYLSTLESKNTIFVHKTLRGGFVVAKNSVCVNELGTSSGIETSVRVENPNGFIRVKLNHINTLLDVNGKRLRTFDTKRDIQYGGVQHD